ncbi:DUF6415 family natural product biosynthesis protein [Streptomyces sp. Lzd4kr]|nr:DUF6415 family natural product biosynthesis protein [Streptomyces sp. Lzd4kr]
MRIPLADRREVRRRDAASGQCGIAAGAGPRRDRAVTAAEETVALVLAEESPLPESAGDVEELARRLRGHISQLAAVSPSGASASRCAQQLASEGVPDGFMPSRVHLVRLAEATQELIVAVRSHNLAVRQTTLARRWRRPRTNAARGVVFAIALACLVLAASVNRT